jgi:hypothetical protein
MDGDCGALSILGQLHDPKSGETIESASLGGSPRRSLDRSDSKSVLADSWWTDSDELILGRFPHSLGIFIAR